MKNFLKIVFGSILGVFIACFIMFWVTIGLFSAIGSSAEKEVNVKPNSILHVSLSTPIMEKTDENPFANFDALNFDPQINLGLNDIMKSLDNAISDDNIKGVFLELGAMPAAFSTLEPIRNKLTELKTADKFIIAYSESYSQKSYYLASIADKIYLNPAGNFSFLGMGSELFFLKKMLDRLKIEPQIFYAGKFKSATEPLRYTEMSDANRLQTKELIDGIYDFYLNTLSSDREISKEDLFDIANEGKIRKPEDALNLKMIDGLMYYDEVLAELRENVGFESDEKLSLYSLGKYNKSISAPSTFGKDRIAVVYAQGSIVDGKGDETSIGSQKFAKIFREVREDDKVKAIVLRVNSGGGSALASEVMWRELQLATATKPVIVSMGDVAASGGYYMSAMADTILAEPNTITGSIGVFSIMPKADKFFDEHLGITFDRVNTGKYSSLFSISKELNEDEKEMFQSMTDRIYDQFLTRVAEGRGMTKEEVNEVAQGRIWTGIAAKENGLVDVLGGLEDAIEIAADKIGMEDVVTVEYPKSKDFAEEIMKQLTGEEVSDKFIQRELGEHYKVYKNVKALTQLQGVQARMPFDIEIK